MQVLHCSFRARLKLPVFPHKSCDYFCRLVPGVSSATHNKLASFSLNSWALSIILIFKCCTRLVLKNNLVGLKLTSWRVSTKLTKVYSNLLSLGVFLVYWIVWVSLLAVPVCLRSLTTPGKFQFVSQYKTYVKVHVVFSTLQGNGLWNCRAYFSAHFW